MDKFIFTAKYGDDLLALLKDSKSAYKTVKWNDTIHHDGKVDVDEHTLLKWAVYDEFKEMDEHIMSGAVPVGGLVVVSDGSVKPLWGFVCGNGNQWHVVVLPSRVQNAVMNFYK